MRLAVADTSPVNYLILIGQIDLLPRMFQRVVLPFAVRRELFDALARPVVRHWITHLLNGLRLSKVERRMRFRAFIKARPLLSIWRFH